MTRFQIATIVVAGALLTACVKEQGEHVEDVQVVEEMPACSAEPVSEVVAVEIAPGLVGKTMTIGCGEPAVAGQLVVVHYTGWLFDGEASNQRGDKFDSSRDRGEHFEFPLGAGRVIKGWDQGVVGMQIGEVRELTIAPEMAYGDREISVIPAGSTLVFEVELFDLKSAEPGASQ